MRITALQLDPSLNRLGDICRQAERLMDEAGESDLYVLPEMWATGFVTRPDAATAMTSGLALVWMKIQARRRGCAIAGSLAQRVVSQSDGSQRWYNRFYFVTPDGSTGFYDKRNLFAYAGEDFVYEAGREPVVVHYRGVRFMLQVCFDLRFPETARRWLGVDYDVLLYVACWPQSRRQAWDALLRARAIENQTYCLGVNRTGMDGTIEYDGGTAAIDPKGRMMFCLDSAVQAASFEVDVEASNAFRSKFPCIPTPDFSR